MRFAEPLPWWGLLGAAVVVAALAVHTWRHAGGLSPLRRGALVALRTLVLLALVGLLMRPVRVDSSAFGRDAVVPVLIDVSRSMQVGDADGRSRFEEAVDVVRSRVLPVLAGRVRVETFGFGGRLEPAEPDRMRPVAARSDLAGALRDLGARFRGQSVPGIVLLSDGAVALPLDPGDVPAQILAVGVGASGPDRSVQSVSIGDLTVSDSVVELTATVVGRGFGTTAIDVRLFENDRPVDVQRVRPVADGSPARVAFRVSSRREQPTVFRVDVASDERELTGANNAATIVAPPSGRPRRVLMIQGAPAFEHSFLKRTWDGDPGVVVDAVVRKGRDDRSRDTYYVQADAARAGALATGFPADRAALFAYDAVVLASCRPDWLGRAAADLLRAFVSERGGGLLLVGRESFDPGALAGSPIEPLVPVAMTGGDPVPAPGATRVDDSPWVLSGDGLEHAVMRVAPGLAPAGWQGLPPLPAVARLGGPRAGAAVLAWSRVDGGAVRPLVAVQRHGAGRVLAFTGEASWRWKMLLPAADRRYDTFWRQALRWAAGGAIDPVSVTATPLDASALDVTARVHDATFVPVRDAQVRFVVSPLVGPPVEHDATLRDAAAGTYGATFDALPAGPYRLDAIARRGGDELGRTTTWTAGAAVDPEMVDPRRDDDALAQVAALGGGRVLGVDEIAALPALLAARRPAEPSLQERDAWHRPWVFLALLTAVCVDWTLRRRWGLR